MSRRVLLVQLALGLPLVSSKTADGPKGRLTARKQSNLIICLPNHSLAKLAEGLREYAKHGDQVRLGPVGTYMADKSVEHLLHLRREYIDECLLMMRYALKDGKKLDGASVQRFEEILRQSEDPNSNALDELAKMHAYLLDVVFPATPRTILHTERCRRDGDGRPPMLVIPLVKRLMVFAAICLVSLVTISLSSHVNGDPRNFNLFASSGLSLLLNELFLISAAGLGAAFSALFKANMYFEEGSYDPRFETSYWLRVILGLVAGTILAMLIPIEEVQKLTHTDGSDLHHLSLNGFGKPLLAIAGGFSASLVYKALIKIVQFLESFLDAIVPTAGPSSGATPIHRVAIPPQPMAPMAPQTASVRTLAIVEPDSVQQGSTQQGPARQVATERVAAQFATAEQVTQNERQNPTTLTAVAGVDSEKLDEPDEPDESNALEGSKEPDEERAFELALKRFVELGEGRRKQVYKDSLGIPTIGIGCNLQEARNKQLLTSMGIAIKEVTAGKRLLTGEEIDEIFSCQMTFCKREVGELFANFQQLSSLRQLVLLDMIFNLGKGRLSKFRKLIRAVEAEDFLQAGQQMQDSRWYSQVGQRGERNVFLMIHNTPTGAPYMPNEVESLCLALIEEQNAVSSRVA